MADKKRSFFANLFRRENKQENINEQVEETAEEETIETALENKEPIVQEIKEDEKPELETTIEQASEAKAEETIEVKEVEPVVKEEEPTLPTIEESEVSEYTPADISLDENLDKIQKAKKAEPVDPSEQGTKKKVEIIEEDEDENIPEDQLEDATETGYNKNLLLKLKVTLNRVQKYYSSFRNILANYKDLKFRSNNSGDTYSLNGKVLVKVSVFERALKVYLPLNPNEYDVKRYRFKDMSDSKHYESIPMRMRVSNDKTYQYLLELFMEVVEKYNLNRSHVKSYDFLQDFKTTSKQLMIENGFEKYLKETCTKDEVNDIPDEVIKKCVMHEVKDTKGSKTLATISIGELSAAFKSSYIIDLDLLKKVGLVDSLATSLYVTKESKCYRAITVKADEFDDEAIKMILACGGNVIKKCN